MKLVVEFDIRGLVIRDEDNNELVRETSQVPSYRGEDKAFNRLRELAKDEWITKCFYKVDGVLRDKIREGIKFKEEEIEDKIANDSELELKLDEKKLKGGKI